MRNKMRLLVEEENPHDTRPSLNGFGCLRVAWQRGVVREAADALGYLIKTPGVASP